MPLPEPGDPTISIRICESDDEEEAWRVEENARMVPLRAVLRKKEVEAMLRNVPSEVVIVKWV